MSGKPKTLGQQGEAAAIAHLKSIGFTILEKNWRTRFAEMDIIAKDNDTFCFVEVKTRQSLKQGLPREALTLPKQKKMIRAALSYCQINRIDNAPLRFDVVEVFKKEGKLTVNLIKHAFQAH